MKLEMKLIVAFEFRDQWSGTWSRAKSRTSVMEVVNKAIWWAEIY
jgi:hypothetical protein